MHVSVPQSLLSHGTFFAIYNIPGAHLWYCFHLIRRVCRSHRLEIIDDFDMLHHDWWEWLVTLFHGFKSAWLTAWSFIKVFRFLLYRRCVMLPQTRCSDFIVGLLAMAHEQRRFWRWPRLHSSRPQISTTPHRKYFRWTAEDSGLSHHSIKQ